jgi:hypothetical protein
MADPDQDQDDQIPPALQGVFAVLLLLGGIVLALLAASLWDDDMPILLRLAMVALPVLAVIIGISGLRRLGQ